MNFLYQLVLILINKILISSQTCVESFNITNQDKLLNIESRKNGDYIIRCVFSISNSDNCTRISYDGLLRVLAVKYAIKEIKQSHKMLPDISVGYIFNDACFNMPKTMGHAIDIVKNYRQNYCKLNGKNGCGLNSSNVVAVVGEYYSFTTINFASLLSLHNIPQISDGASSPLLSNRKRFKSFFRTIQPDDVQIEIIVATLKKFNWKYIFAIGSDDDYGKIALNTLRKRVTEENFCVVQDVYMPLINSPTQMQKHAQDIVTKLQNFEKAKVVIMFNYAKGMGEYVLREAEHRNITRLWFTSEAWNPEILTADVPKKQLESLLSVSLKYGNEIPSFKLYIADTVKSEYNCDIWLNTLINNEFKCNVKRKSVDSKYLLGSSTTNESCNVSIDNIITTLYKQNLNQVNYLINAITAIGHSLHYTACNKTQCRANILPAEILETLKNVSFNTTSGQLFEFDSDHNPRFSQYSIEQVHLNGSTAAFVDVGRWHSQKMLLNISLEKLKWPSWSRYSLPVSICNNDCQPGYKVEGEQHCCWTCKRCSVSEISYSFNAKNCSRCPDDHNTTDNIKCVQKRRFYVSYSHPIGIFGIILSSIGVFLMFALSLIFLTTKKKIILQYRVELFFYILCIVSSLSFFYTLIELAQPSKTICLARYIYIFLMLTSYSLIIFGMNLSVHRFFAKLVTRKGTILLSLFIFFLLSFELFLLLLTLRKRTTYASIVNTDYEITKICAVDRSVYSLLAIIFPLMLLLTATVLAFSERDSKYYLNELKHLYFFGMSQCIITVAYILSINQVNALFQTLVTLITTNGYGYAFIFCLAFPKVYGTLQAKKSKNEPDLKTKKVTEQT
ncbi:extracellular calcium-sensing receptor isoform X1 [Hydra vulgaris]|uniref:extracellular calcium-sensing receptor isoform X1 n=1 Tax=Hydra vulgaris TaxID=6087 RepID=UPI001F5E9659|nr:extracellular calcium-sensing receptor [Hydra vulgaris]